MTITKKITIMVSLLALITTTICSADEDHQHHEKQAGPNGGKMFTTDTSSFELFLAPDRHIEVRFFDAEGKILPNPKQTASLIGGNRQNPIKMTFALSEGVLRSNSTIPEGSNLPIILSLQNKTNQEKQRFRIQLNTAHCPECPYLEYACTCDH